jgi:hypothetical protein
METVKSALIIKLLQEPISTNVIRIRVAPVLLVTTTTVILQQTVGGADILRRVQSNVIQTLNAPQQHPQPDILVVLWMKLAMRLAEAKEQDIEQRDTQTAIQTVGVGGVTIVTTAVTESRMKAKQT